MKEKEKKKKKKRKGRENLIFTALFAIYIPYMTCQKRTFYNFCF